MKTKICPMCKGEQFYFVWTGISAQISIGLFKSIPVYSAVCLACGFVAPTVDEGGLVALREKARSEGIEIAETPVKQEFQEV
jgi:hypothetical protein